MNTIDMASFGETLKFFRKQQGMTQKQLAAKVGVHANTIWAWERGDYLPETKGFILEIAHQLGLDDFETRQLLEASLMYSSSLPYWSVPYQRNPFFVGRRDLLRHLHQTLQGQRKENRAASCALSGMGGIGKTQTALEYAYHYFQDYAAVFWVNAETRESMIASFAAIAKVLSLPQRAESQPCTIITAVREWLNSHSDWLMILDTVEDVQLIKPSLPSARQGTLLFTTRLHTLGTLASMIELDRLSTPESTELLLRRMHHLDERHTFKQLSPDTEALAQTLADLMDGLPLALDQAGAYLQQTQCNLREFLRLFEACPVQLLNERDVHVDHPFSVARTFALAFEQLQKEQPVAAQLLVLCCFLAPDEIPEVLFTEHTKDLGLPLYEAVNHPLRMNALFKELLAHSLIRRHPHRRTISVHRLVQVVLQKRLPETEQREWNERVIRLLDRAVQADPDQPPGEQGPLYELLLPHVLHCLQQATRLHSEAATLGSLLARMATYLYQRARYQEAELLYRQAISILQRHAEPTHADLARAVTGLSTTQQRLNEGQEFKRSEECCLA